MTSTYAHCPHERRPGTTVCLHCRHEELETARRRRRDFFSRAGLVAMGLGALGVAGVAVAGAVQSRLAGSTVVASTNDSAPRQAKAHVADAPRRANERTTESNAGAFSVSLASSAARYVAVIAPVIPEGRSELGDSVFAVREGNNIAVHFDTQLSRTRRRDKFEHIVRTTLPKVLGAEGDSILAHLPEGAMASGDLVTELTQRGIRLPAPAGWTIVVWPQTRAGQDGPLVVSYRLTVAR